MKDKIYRLLKQAYSKLGLADEVLQAQAEMLEKLGIVTEDNVETVVEAQKSYLESLQKENDRRVTDAQKKFQAEQQAKEEADKKAKEEAEKKRLEELAKQNEMPEYLKKYFEEQSKKDKEREDAHNLEREEYKKLVSELKEFNQKQQDAYTKQIKEQGDTITELKDTLKKQQEEAKAEKEALAREKAIADHKAKIVSKAKELGIPQSRIDEGFVIADDADDETINNVLTKVSNNCKTLMQPSFGSGFHANLDEKATDKEIDDVADSLVSSL